MAQFVQFEDQTLQFPDHFTQADIQRALSNLPRSQRLADVPASDRRFPMAGDGGVVAAPAKPGGMFDDLIPPLPPGYTLDPPAAARTPPPAVDRKPGMFDELIPKQPSPAPRSGMFDDLIPPSSQRQPKLVPVDHDPFASSAGDVPAPRRPKLVPVDYDPFAAGKPPFDPSQPFQEAAAPAPIVAAVPVTPGGVPIGPNGLPRVEIAPARPTGQPSAPHSLAVGTQGVGAGVRDIVAMPFDLAAGAQNAIAGGLNKILGPNLGHIPYATPASKIVEHIAEPYSIPENEMSPGEKLGYKVNRFGTQALGMGAMLAARAPAVAEAVKPAETAVGRFFDTMSRTYTAAPARTVVGDTIGGMGAGAAVDAAENYVPKEAVVGGKYPRMVAEAIAPLAGGMGANTIQGAAEGVGGLIRGLAKKALSGPTKEIPLNPNTRAPYPEAAIENAARRLQGAASGSPKALAQDIRENAAELLRPQAGERVVDASALPTTGLLSRDPGLISLEQGTRLRSSPDFIERDQNVKEAAAERVEGMRDPDADLGAVVRRAGQARKERLAIADEPVRNAEEHAASLDRAQREAGAAFTPIANSQAQANASRQLDEALVDRTYVPARAEKNRLFDTAPGRAEELPADDIFAAIDRVRRNANGLAPGTLPNDFMHRLDALRPRIDPETGANVGGPGTASGGNLADLRKYIKTAQQRAQQSGNFDLADNISVLGRAINRTIEGAPGYAEANGNYGQFANRYRPEPNDEMAKFTREIDRGGQRADGTLNRGATPPSETAGRFLNSPEAAATLPRALEGSPAAPAAQAAVRDYYRSDFAKSALNPDGTINHRRALAWTNMQADVLAQFPALRREFDDLISTTSRGEQMSAQAMADLEAARAGRQATEAELDRSAVGTLLRQDPRDVASKLLSDKYSSGKRLDEINALVAHDEAARRGWKAAVAEVLADRVQGTRQVGETPEVQFARLAKEFKDNEGLLAKTFDAEEMSNLRQAHKLLEYFKEAEKRSTVGSDTAEKLSIPGSLQLGARHLWGDLKGGGIIKRMKLLLEMLPSNKHNVDEIVHMAWFNPDVAAYLLERPIKNSIVPGYNVNLRRLIAAANASRESGAE
ncbi:hypothetical protein H8A97_10120 [Bradyrhizobium sp. Arg62]|uniref:hypothetical protein n=1 Tax=Bradyrhizobium brasilense TaxID=1419277 RepID=UPI001E33F348|nr:hypothetical protein [Bradyrhizobium brasilense]MCC8945446.1 hypothetical protein [Bradyrhizobium brasilense]